MIAIITITALHMYMFMFIRCNNDFENQAQLHFGKIHHHISQDRTFHKGLRVITASHALCTQIPTGKRVGWQVFLRHRWSRVDD